MKATTVILLIFVVTNAKALELNDLNFSDVKSFHPYEQKIINKFYSRLENTDLTQTEKEAKVKKKYKTVMKFLNIKVKNDYLPFISRNCPTIIDQLWEKSCKKSSSYKHIYTDISKYYCIVDNKENIEPRCLPSRKVSNSK